MTAVPSADTVEASVDLGHDRSGAASGVSHQFERVLCLRGLTVSYGGQVVVDRVDLDAHQGEVVCVLGASGSGKTTLLQATMGLVPTPGQVRADLHLLAAGDEILDLANGDRAGWRHARARHLGVVYQDASQALTPLRRVGSLLREVLTLRNVSDPDGAVADALRWAGFTRPGTVARLRCCDLSGGMAQRLGLALAVAGGPSVLLADEPTTALDGRARVALVARLREVADGGAAVIVVTHDVHVAASLADTVVLVDRGRVVEHGPAAQILVDTDHPVVRCITTPRPTPPTRRSDGPPVLSLRGIAKAFPTTGAVLRAVDLDVAPGELVGIIGRSGAGKSTLVRTVVGLEAPDTGCLLIAGLDPAADGWRRVRRAVQLVPQDPRASLNPWRRAWQLVADPLAAHHLGTRARRRQRALDLLDRVGLAQLADRRPGELSTGQCQRVAIARALAVEPRLVVADEPVASLDAHLRAGALALLRAVAAEHHTAMVIVSHDLAALEATCDRLVVLDGGIVEDLPASQVRTGATHPLTRDLIACYPTDPLAPLRPDRKDKTHDPHRPA